MPALSLYCSVCEDEFLDKETWLEHLVTSVHQKPARVGSCGSWEDSVKASVLVAFSNQKFSSKKFSLSFLKQLGNKGRGDAEANGKVKEWGVVSDFVWWKTKPQMGFIQFENSDIIKRILAEGLCIQVENHVVQLKKANDYLPMEWCNLIPDPEIAAKLIKETTVCEDVLLSNNGGELSVKVKKEKLEYVKNEDENSVQNSGMIKARKRKGKASEEVENGDCSTTTPTPPPVPTSTMVIENYEDNETPLKKSKKHHRVKEKKTTVVEETDNKLECSITVASPTPPSTVVEDNEEVSSSTSPVSNSAPLASPTAPIRSGRRVSSSTSHRPFLYSNLLSCFAKIEIPDEEYAKTAQFVSTLETFLNRYFPDCKVSMFRNWHMKIKSNQKKVNGTSQEDDVLLFIYKYIFNSNNRNYRSEDALSEEQVGKTIQTFSGTRVVSSSGNSIFEHQPSRVLFQITCDPKCMVEIQTDRLLRYLCSFDQRCLAVLKLIRFWARLNGVSLADPNSSSHWQVPDPAALDWLLINYLTRIKFIPSVREILQRPHRSLMIQFTKPVDIGFCDDKRFAEEWKTNDIIVKSSVKAIQGRSMTPGGMKTVELGSEEKFSDDVVFLAYDFFHVIGKIFKFNRVFVNTKDGILVSLNKPLKSNAMESRATSLTIEELAVVSSLPQLSKLDSLPKRYVYVMHPLCPYFSMSVHQGQEELQRIFQLMSGTHGRLHNFVKQREKLRVFGGYVKQKPLEQLLTLKESTMK